MEEILVITTGGTIDKVYFDAKSDFEVGQSVVEELLREAHVGIGYKIVELMRKDSLDLTVADREMIRQAIVDASNPSSGNSADSAHPLRVVITHGTDTMTNTAEAIAQTVVAAGATVVLTGSLSPARFAHSDATFNVGMAFAVSQMKAAPGVYIVMNGQVFDGLTVVKDRTQNQFVLKSGEREQ